MAIGYTKKMFIERLRRHIANGWPNDSFSATDNEVLLYIDEALAFGLVGQVYATAKLEGNLVMPEAYLSTYLLADLVQDDVTGYWYSTLPQPPISLPLGYSINQVYFAKTAYSKSQAVFPIKAKRLSYREDMPLPNGVRYWVEGSRIWLQASSGQPLLGQPLYVQMAKTRTDDLSETMDLPDDAIKLIFDTVVGRMVQRLGLPQDIIKDNLPAGNKSS